MRLIHHGGHHGVTGSCHELRLDNGGGILIDCGVFQGEDARMHPDLHVTFPVDHLQAMALTHAHIDHVGRLPYLLSAGFRGRIYCTPPTARLLPLVLEDALKIGFTRNTQVIQGFLAQVKDHLCPVACETWHDVADGVKVRLKRAGHILGSAYVEVDAEGQRVVFSGDLGATYAPLLYAPKSPYRADLLVLESTYGDRAHEGRRERQQRLQAVLERTLENKGTTLIPAFSLGRTQELLYELNAILGRMEKRRGPSLLREVDVIVDSPLAARFTEIYGMCARFWDAEAQRRLRYGDHPLVFENLMTVGDHEEHRWTVDYLQRRRVPAIVIAGSGMCTGGRIVNYLKALLGEPSTDVLFVGYQGRGTPGRRIQEGRRWVRLDGDRVAVRAEVHTLSGYSAHADQNNLVNFVRRMRRLPGQVRLIHGEPPAKRALREKLVRLGVRVG